MQFKAVFYGFLSKGKFLTLPRQIPTKDHKE